jgi:hypothetical protein
MSIRVRRHQRELASGKTTTVRQHERRGNAREQEVPEGGSWWDGSGEAVPAAAGAHPEGSSFFRQDDEVFAVHPDGTVHPVERPGEGMSPEMARLLGADTPEGAERVRRVDALRDSGYTGPRDADGYATPQSPREFRQAKRAAQRRANTAPTRDESEDASAEWHRLDDADRARRNPPLNGMQKEMRWWRKQPEPVAKPDKPMSPQMAKLLGCGTPEGRAKYDRLRAYREAGYDGPLDQDNRIPDPDDPANYESLSALAALREI